MDRAAAYSELHRSLVGGERPLSRIPGSALRTRGDLVVTAERGDPLLGERTAQPRAPALLVQNPCDLGVIEFQLGRGGHGVGEGDDLSLAVQDAGVSRPRQSDVGEGEERVTRKLPGGRDWMKRSAISAVRSLDPSSQTKTSKRSGG
jgi:hypothetical protein